MKDLEDARNYVSPWYGVLIAICMAAMLTLVGCGTVKIEVDPETGKFTMETKTLFKNIEAGEIQTDDMIGSVGSSTTDQNAESALLLVCALNPAMPMCQIDE